jgi:glycosyltransferase involved in cell wall biosynthesis
VPRLLLVSYFFPPIGGVGAQRALRFARYLPEHGWDVTVLAPATSNYALVDEFPTARDGGYEVARTRSIDVPRRYSRLGQRIYPVVMFPDDRRLWALHASRVAGQLARTCDVVMSSALPMTSHIVGRAATRAGRLPWVVDFQDPYVTNPHLANAPRARSRERLERRVLSEASAITVVTDDMERDFAARTESPVTVIENGFDPDEFAAASTVSLPGQRTLVYLGSLYGSQSLVPVVEAMRLACERAPHIRETLMVHFVGSVADWQKAHALQSDVADMVSFTSYVPRQEALGIMLGADALLLLLSEDLAHAATGKVFDYLGSGRPILALVPPSPAGRIAAAAGGTVTHTIEDFADALIRLAGDGLPSAAPAESEAVARYAADRLTSRFVDVLDEVLGRSRAPVAPLRRER